MGVSARDQVKQTEVDWLRQNPLWVGLLSQFLGTTDLGEIEAAYRKLISRGQEILGTTPGLELPKLLNAKGIARRRLK